MDEQNKDKIEAAAAVSVGAGVGGAGGQLSAFWNSPLKALQRHCQQVW
jgi:hypothetical protein